MKDPRHISDCLPAELTARIEGLKKMPRAQNERAQGPVTDDPREEEETDRPIPGGSFSRRPGMGNVIELPIGKRKRRVSPNGATPRSVILRFHLASERHG